MVDQSTTSNINITDAVLHQAPVMNEEIAIKQIIDLHSSYLQRDEELHLQGVNAQDVPVVHPTIHEVWFDEKNTSAPFAEKDEPIDHRQLYRHNVIKQVYFDDLLGQKGKFISIIGNAGCGKTILSKRLTKSSSWPQRLSFHVNFKDTNYEKPLTLRKYLLDNIIPGQNEKVYEDAFNWLKKNDEKLVLVLDGFDQAEYTIDKKCPKINYDDCVPENQLVYNLFRRHFFPRSLLVVTSRPHSMLHLPKLTRPQVTYALGDLCFGDTRQLFLAFADAALWDKVKSNFSQMLSMCRNPLMLQIMISSNIHPSEDIGDASTVTRLFATVMGNLTISRNFQDAENLVEKLRVLAFDATKNGKVAITAQQLRDGGVDSTTVRDIVVQLHANKHPMHKIHLFKGSNSLCFCHQTFQDHITASYIVHAMPLEQFVAFAEESLFNDYWTIVRRFVSGFLLDMESRTCSENLQKKREILKTNLIRHLRIISDEFMKLARDRNDALTHKLLDLYACVGEGKDSSIATIAAEHFPAKLVLPQPMNSNLVPGFCFVMKHVTKQLERLSLWGCYLDENSFHQIASAIKEMKPGQIGRMLITYNNLQSSNIDDIIALLRVVRDDLWMFNCFSDTPGGKRYANQDEQNKIQEYLNEIQSELKIEVVTGTTLRAK
ncbi:protein NLRC5-like [Clavelina lepadiformis]|uniref:protein NLRC5-like n=1 Tax=Clavelina lepadiformis TaxID=159417 RepID=UPI00404393BD